MPLDLTPSDRLFLTYCGKDCCVTYECNEVIDRKLQPGQRKHYEFNMSVLPAILYMELRGIRYDYEKAKAKLKAVQRQAYRLQELLDRAAGRQGYLDFLEVWKDHQAGNEAPFIKLLAQRFCVTKPRRRKEWEETKTYKNGKTKVIKRRVSEAVEIQTLADCREFARVPLADDLRSVSALIGRRNRSRELRGRLSELLDAHVKVGSTGQDGDACWFLYERCGFTRQYQKEGNKLTDKLASDDEALIKIIVEEEKKPRVFDGAVRLKHRGRLALVFLKLRRLLTQTKTLRVAPDADGRMRCAYNLVGAETARLTCYESPTGSGYNLQTVTKKHRDLFLADDGHLIGQRDLEGADAWTVAAYAAAQGDRSMLNDCKAGLRPAKITALMCEQGPSVNKLSLDDLKQACKAVDKEGWLYFANKQITYGGSYGMGGKTMSDGILTKSWKLTGKPVFMSPSECERIQKQCFFVRYWGIPRWHKWMEAELQRNGFLMASNGFKRVFFGRKDEHKTVKAALAHLPQVMTTWATVMALHRLWVDPDNRQPDGSLREEPLHTVHDSLLTMFKQEDLEWSATKGQEWFNNPVLIASEMIVIPYEGAAGRDWKNLDAGMI